MANVNFPHGLKPIGRLSGGPQYIETFAKAVGYATAIFVFDAVNRVADASIEASATPGTTAYTGVSLDYGAASTATNHLVYVSPDALFEAQEDGSGTIDAVDLGLNANLVLTAGNTLTHVSKHQIAGSTKQTTSSLDVHLLNFFNVPDNAFGANARIEIMFNKHRMSPATAGV